MPKAFPQQVAGGWGLGAGGCPLLLTACCLSEQAALIRTGCSAGVQPRLIQGIRSGDGVGDLFNYLFIKDIKSNRIRIAQ